MVDSISDTKNISDTEKSKGPGRPSTGIGPNVGLRLHPDLSEAIDQWISERPDPKPSRPEAIRTLLKIALGLPG
jgi:hypothetical protein